MNPAISSSFIRSDNPVYVTASFRPSGLSHPTTLARLTFSYLRNPDPFCGSHNFYGCLYPGVRRVHGGFPDIRCLDPYKRKLSGAWTHTNASSTSAVWSLRRLCYICPATLGPSAPGPPGYAPGPPGYDRYGLFDSFLGQQTRRDTLSHLVTFNSRASPLVRGSERYSPSKTFSRLSERDSRPPISSEAANSDRVVPTPRDSSSYLQGLGDTRDRHVCHSVELPPTTAHVSNSPIPDPRAIAVDALSQVWQGRSMLVIVHVSPHSPCSTEFLRRSHSDGRDDSHSPWWPN